MVCINLAVTKFPSDMHDASTWCKTDVFSSDNGLISRGQNIQCSGAKTFGGSSKPVEQVNRLC